MATLIYLQTDLPARQVSVKVMCHSPVPMDVHVHMHTHIHTQKKVHSKREKLNTIGRKKDE